VYKKKKEKERKRNKFVNNYKNVSLL